MINNRTDSLKTDINLFFTITNGFFEQNFNISLQYSYYSMKGSSLSNFPSKCCGVQDLLVTTEVHYSGTRLTSTLKVHKTECSYCPDVLSINTTDSSGFYFSLPCCTSVAHDEIQI